MLGAQEDATQIDGYEALEVLVRVVFEHHAEAGRGYADVVVHDVQLPELVDGHVEHGDDIVFGRTSAPTGTAVPPASSMSRTVCLARSTSRSAQTTRAPSSAKRSAEARPTPDPAPVMTVFLPSSLIRPISLVHGERDGSGRAGLDGGSNFVETVGRRCAENRPGVFVLLECARGVGDAEA